MFRECRRRNDESPSPVVCSICTASNASDASKLTIQSSSPTAVLQRALLHHMSGNSSSFVDMLPSLDEYFAKISKSNSSECISAHANKGVLSLIWQILSKSWHDVPTEYDSLPCEIRINDTESVASKVEHIPSNIIKYLCDMCKSLLKSYCTFERFCERIVFKILRLSFKPMLLVQTSKLPQSRAEDEKTDTNNVKAKNLNSSVKSRSNCSIEKKPTIMTQKKKRGRPRKKLNSNCNANDKLSTLDLSKSLCPFCHKQYSIRHSFVHSCLKYRNSLRCPECNVFSSSYVRFEKHLETYHQEKKRFICDVDNCKQKFISEPAFKWHNHFHTLEERSNVNFNPNPIDSNDLTSTNSPYENVYIKDPFQYNNIDNELCNNENLEQNLESLAQSCEGITVEGEEARDEESSSQFTKEQFSKTKNLASPVYFVLSETPSDVTEPRFLMSDSGLMLSTADHWSDVQHGTDLEPESQQKVVNLPFNVTDPAAVTPCSPEEFCNNLYSSGDGGDQTSIIQSVLVDNNPPNFSQASDSLVERNTALSKEVPNSISVTNSSSHEEAASRNSSAVLSTDFPESSNPSEKLVDHICSQHRTSEQEFECPVCDKPFKSIPVLIEHLNKHSDLEPCKCLICSVNVKNKTAKSKLALSFEASDLINLKCSMCSVKFETCDQLLEHNLCLRHNLQTQEPLLGSCPSKSEAAMKNSETFPHGGDVQPSQVRMVAVPVPQLVSNDGIPEHCSSKNSSLAGSLLQSSVGLPVEGVFAPPMSCDTPGDEDVYQYGAVTTATGVDKSMEQVSANEETLSNIAGYRTSNPVLSYHQGTSSLSFSLGQTALNMAGQPPGVECSEEDLGRQRLSCDSCGQLFLGHSALASHAHSCQTFGSKLDPPFHDDNFLPATENLSVVNALEGSSGTALTPIERLIGSVDDMDYFE